MNRFLNFFENTKNYVYSLIMFINIHAIIKLILYLQHSTTCLQLFFDTLQLCVLEEFKDKQAVFKICRFQMIPEKKVLIGPLRPIQRPLKLILCQVVIFGNVCNDQ